MQFRGIFINFKRIPEKSYLFDVCIKLYKTKQEQRKESILYFVIQFEYHFLQELDLGRIDAKNNPVPFQFNYVEMQYYVTLILFQKLIKRIKGRICLTVLRDAQK